MPVFQDILWGYALTYPEGWIHQAVQDTEAFAEKVEALSQDYSGPQAGQILVRPELNPFRQAIEPIWSQHIARSAGMIGARDVRSAPWRLAGASGLEAEIALAKKEKQRFWTGVLQRHFVVMKFVVIHPMEERRRFEPLATQLISSLQFITHAMDLPTTPDTFPLPPDYTPADPRNLVNDIQDLTGWRAYTGSASIAALQAFYLREAPNYGWAVLAYDPFPGRSDLGFARLELRQEKRSVTLGILPAGGASVDSSSPANLALKYSFSPGANH